MANTPKCIDFLPELSPSDREGLDQLITKYNLPWALLKLEQNAYIPKPYFPFKPVRIALGIHSTYFNGYPGERVTLGAGYASARLRNEYTLELHRRHPHYRLLGGRVTLCDAKTIVEALSRHRTQIPPMVAPVPIPVSTPIEVPQLPPELQGRPWVNDGGRLWVVCEPEYAQRRVSGAEQIDLVWKLLANLPIAGREQWKRRLMDVELCLCTPEAYPKPKVTMGATGPLGLESTLRQELVQLSAYGLRPLIQEWAVPDGNSFRRYDLVDLALQPQGYIEIIELKRDLVTRLDIEQKVFQARYLRLAHIQWPEARIRLVFVSPRGMTTEAWSYLMGGGADLADVSFRSYYDQKLRLAERIKAERLPQDMPFLLNEVRHMFAQPTVQATH